MSNRLIHTLTVVAAEPGVFGSQSLLKALVGGVCLLVERFFQPSPSRCPARCRNWLVSRDSSSSAGSGLSAVPGLVPFIVTSSSRSEEAREGQTWVRSSPGPARRTSAMSDSVSPNTERLSHTCSHGRSRGPVLWGWTLVVSTQICTGSGSCPSGPNHRTCTLVFAGRNCCAWPTAWGRGPRESPSRWDHAWSASTASHPSRS